ncbi:unnamed protein product, partial [Nesidiocoris tenuis]
MSNTSTGLHIGDVIDSHHQCRDMIVRRDQITFPIAGWLMGKTMPSSSDGL